MATMALIFMSSVPIKAVLSMNKIYVPLKLAVSCGYTKLSKADLSQKQNLDGTFKVK